MSTLKINGNEIFSGLLMQSKPGSLTSNNIPGKKTLVTTKANTILMHTIAVCPWYLHEKTSVQDLPRASNPITLKGCVGILPDGYQWTNPLPQIPTKQSVPTGREVLPGYFGLPIRIPTLCSLIGPAVGKAQIPWLPCH